MLINEKTRECLIKTMESLSEQTGYGAVSALLIVVATKDGLPPGDGSEFKVASITEIPKELNSVQHDLIMMRSVVDFVAAREAGRQGGSGPVKIVKP